MGARKTRVSRYGNNSPTPYAWRQLRQLLLTCCSFLGFIHTRRRHNASFQKCCGQNCPNLVANLQKNPDCRSFCSFFYQKLLFFVNNLRFVGEHDTGLSHIYIKERCPTMFVNRSLYAFQHLKQSPPTQSKHHLCRSSISHR